MKNSILEKFELLTLLSIFGFSFSKTDSFKKLETNLAEEILQMNGKFSETIAAM